MVKRKFLDKCFPVDNELNRLLARVFSTIWKSIEENSCFKTALRDTESSVNVKQAFRCLRPNYLLERRLAFHSLWAVGMAAALALVQVWCFE